MLWWCWQDCCELGVDKQHVMQSSSGAMMLDEGCNKPFSTYQGLDLLQQEGQVGVQVADAHGAQRC